MSDYDNLNTIYNESISSHTETTSEEEMDILQPDNNCREYKIGQKVRLRSGGEGFICDIVYAVLIGEMENNDAAILKGKELGEIINGGI